MLTNYYFIVKDKLRENTFRASKGYSDFIISSSLIVFLPFHSSK